MFPDGFDGFVGNQGGQRFGVGLPDVARTLDDYGFALPSPVGLKRMPNAAAIFISAASRDQS